MLGIKRLWFSLLLGLLFFVGCYSAEEEKLDTDEEGNTTGLEKQEEAPEGSNGERTQHMVLAAESTPFVLGKTLLGDFNGDRQPDTLQEINDGELAGYLAILSGEGTPDTLGMGRVQGVLYDDFSWVDSWQVIDPGNYDEVIFSTDGDIVGSRKITTSFEGIELLANESGGGILAWNHNIGWFWIHQTD